MSPPNPQIQWYLARDGKQFGPLSELELAKFIELGHMLPTDLLWREGFAEWRTAISVFPPKPAPAPAPARAPAAVQPIAPQAAPARAQRAPDQRLEMRAEPRLDHKPQQRFQPQQPAQQRTGQQQAAPAGMAAQRAGMAGAAAAYRAPVQGAVQQQPAPDYRDFDDDADFEPGGTVLRRAMALILILGTIGAAGYFGWPYRNQVLALAGLDGSSATKSAVVVSDRRALDVPPLKGLEGSATEIDANLQQAALWRILKRDFPDWYDARIKQVVELNARNTDKAEVAQQISQTLVALRRQQLNNALSASTPRLKLVATSFFENLVQLRKTSDVACFEFIARGEASPLIVTMLQGSPQMPQLHAQLAAVYEAIADGRKTPRAYPSPRREDYEALAADLTKARGWSQEDLQLFTNEKALAQAPPGKVCQLVHDWFAAQLDVKDPDMQVRLLVDSLKPVVAG